MNEEPGAISYLSAADIRDIHGLIVESNSETTAGVSSAGDIEYAVEHIQDARFDQSPQSNHEKAFQLLRLLTANHPFVDGNKRTALMSTRIFYALNGRRFDYDREIKEILKALATDEAGVDAGDVIAYLQAHTEPLAPEYEATITLWLAQIEDTAQLPPDENTGDGESHEPNDYHHDSHFDSLAAESDPPEIPDTMSAEEARQYLIRFLGRQDLDEHDEIYDELATE